MDFESTFQNLLDFSVEFHVPGWNNLANIPQTTKVYSKILSDNVHNNRCEISRIANSFE